MQPAFFSFIALASALGSANAVQAQAVGRSPRSVTSLDSSKVYTYVAQMPEYPGGRQALIADLRREFQVASTAAGCATPAFPVFVRLVVGPSGYVYAARSLNGGADDKRQLLPTTMAVNLPPLPPACEAAIATAARRLARWQPGRQNNKPVTVDLMVKMLDGSK